MTTDNKYNGWTNYETWRVKLEILDYFDLEGYSKDPYELSKQLEDYVEEVVFIETPDGLAKDYASAFLRQVNYYEIAEHLVEDYKYDHPDEVEESEV